VVPRLACDRVSRVGATCGAPLWRYILRAGRWLAKRHANVVSPDQWTEELALAMRTAVLEETSVVFVSAVGRQHLRSRGQVGNA